MAFNPNFLAPGVSHKGGFELAVDTEPKPLTVPLQQAKKEFVFFLPYIPWAAYPDTAINPWNVLCRDLNCVVPQFFVASPYPLITNLKQLRERGIATNNLFAIPRKYAGISTGVRLIETTKGIVCVESTTGRHAYYGVQKVSLVDWTASLSRPVASLESITLTAYAWTLQFATERLQLRADRGVGDVPVNFRCQADLTGAAPEILELVRRMLDLDQTLVDQLDIPKSQLYRGGIEEP